MNTLRIVPLVVAIVQASASLGHAQWALELDKTLDGFAVPECVVVAEDGSFFVSNIESEPDAYWSDDGKGFISHYDADGTCSARRWLNSEPGAVLNAPKGMCLLGNQLYFTDNNRLMKASRMAPSNLVEVKIEGAVKLNDIATDGRDVWVSDTGAGKIYRVNQEGQVKVIKAPDAVNGVTCADGKVFAVSWEEHDLYQVDPAGEKEPEPFGLADHFTNLDGIEVLEDGCFLVSDFYGHQVCLVSADRRNVKRLAEVESAADIGLDRERGLLYVPRFMKDDVLVFKISRQTKIVD